MKNIIIFIMLLALELIYFKVANRFNIIDKPNERSSHSSITLRGGGIIFYFSVLIFFILSDFEYPWFFLGLTLMTLISFLDDVFTLSNKTRLIIHFISVLLMAYQLQLFNMPWYFLLICFVLVVGVINAYNFMDGINGITACNSLSVIGLLIIVNQKQHFIANDLLVFSILGILVFSFFNFRTKAKCFAGDVGSVSIAYIILFALGKLILNTGDVIYILFLAVYGIDTVWTIMRRIYRKENIFEAHRSHLYQFLGNEARINKLVISFFYGVIQFAIGLLVIDMVSSDIKTKFIFSVVLVTVLSCVYLVLKTYVIKKYVKN